MQRDDPRQPKPCDMPTGEHAPGRARLYPCGWRCDNHRPRPRVTPVDDRSR